MAHSRNSKADFPGAPVVKTLRAEGTVSIPGWGTKIPHASVKVKVAQPCLTLCDPMDYRDHGILQARIRVGSLSLLPEIFPTQGSTCLKVWQKKKKSKEQQRSQSGQNTVYEGKGMRGSQS